jgi:hypothetical protein
MKGLVSLVLIVLATALLMSAPRSQPSPPAPPLDNAGALPEPTTETPVMPAPGSESIVKNPFSPYDIGPPEAAWSYDQLTPPEKTIADRGRDVTGWQTTHDAYRAAVLQLSARAQAAAAAQQLGVANVETIGVVP